MRFDLRWALTAVSLLLYACGGSSLLDTGSVDNGGDNGTGGLTNNNGGTIGADTGDVSGNGGTGGPATLSGHIVPNPGAKILSRAQAADSTYMVVTQSNESGQIYRGTTDASGSFEVAIPESEAGNTFAVAILGPDGKPVGPVVLGQSGNEGVTGLRLEGEATLGTMALPVDPTQDPIQPGTDANVADLVDPNLTARLNANGVPVGLESYGKGSDARAGAGTGQLVDGDQDGLIDLFDADDDGDGVLDDFDGNVNVGAGPKDIHVNFFMNLKIGAEDAQAYYAGTAEQIAAALGTETIITLECMMEPGATRSITAVHALAVPGPVYLPLADGMSNGLGGLTFSNWAATGYAFGPETDRFDVFVRPNMVMEAGDTFTIEVAFSDGTTEQYSRMINYVFKNIPRLLEYGTATSRQAFDVTSPIVNGSPSQPIPLDDTQNLVLVINPPVDEVGAYLTDLERYAFSIFYERGGTQLNSDMDWSATWPAPPAGFDHGTYDVATANMDFDATSNQYTVTLPKELFADTVQTSHGTAAVTGYKIDITAVAPTGNAAIMLSFVK